MNIANSVFHALNNTWHVVGHRHRGLANERITVAFGTRHVDLTKSEYDKLQAGYLRPCDFRPIAETDSDENEVRAARDARRDYWSSFR